MKEKSGFKRIILDLILTQLMSIFAGGISMVPISLIPGESRVIPNILYTVLTGSFFFYSVYRYSYKAGFSQYNIRNTDKPIGSPSRGLAAGLIVASPGIIISIALFAFQFFGQRDKAALLYVAGCFYNLHFVGIINFFTSPGTYFILAGVSLILPIYSGIWYYIGYKGTRFGR